MTVASPVEVPVKPHRLLVDGRRGNVLRTAAAAIGATCFSLGACLFILQSFQENWLPVYQVGCITWIVGCMPYLALALANVRKVALSSTVLLVSGLTTYVVGCVLASAQTLIMRYLRSMPASAVGSVLLLVDSVLELRRQWAQPDLVCLTEFLAASFFCVAAGWAVMDRRFSWSSWALLLASGLAFVLCKAMLYAATEYEPESVEF